MKRGLWSKNVALLFMVTGSPLDLSEEAFGIKKIIANVKLFVF